MQRACDHCGRQYEAKRPQSRFCRNSCRASHSQRPGTSVINLRGDSQQPRASTAPAPSGVPAGVTASVEAQLVAADRVDTPLGQAALVLARRLDSGTLETGPALASLAKQLEATLLSATKGAAVAPDQIDELRRRREQKFGA